MVADEGFLNVDLELGARTQVAFDPIVAALSGKVLELYRGPIGTQHRLHLEGSGRATASQTMRVLLSLIERLESRAMRAWKALAVRDFNIGVELARGVKNIELALDSDVVARVAAVGGRIAFTAYQVAELERATKIHAQQVKAAAKKQRARAGAKKQKATRSSKKLGRAKPARR